MKGGFYFWKIENGSLVSEKSVIFTLFFFWKLKQKKKPHLFPLPLISPSINCKKKKGMLTKIDYADNGIQHFKSKLPAHMQFVAFNTNVPHVLAESDYGKGNNNHKKNQYINTNIHLHPPL